MNRWSRQILATAALFFLISYLLGSIDYWRVQDQRRPLFVMAWTGFFDGGTHVGFGFGYYVIANHGAKYSMEHKKAGDGFYWTEGPELRFWLLPFLNKSELSFRPIKTSS